MQQKQQRSEPKNSERKEPKGRDESEPNSGSDRDEQQENPKESMNFTDTSYVNTTPGRDQYGGLGGWPPSPGPSSPSPGMAKLFSGYKYPSISTMDSFQIEGQLASLSREEQATDASYTMLLAPERNASSTASIDGKIQEPHMSDVLCGRGGSINSHPGNRVFRGWIAQRKESYNLAESKAGKSSITAEILRTVRDQNPPGRFLQKIAEAGTSSKSSDPYTLSGWWHEVDDTKALAKISQALREGAPAFRALHGKKGQKKHSKRPPHRAAGSTKNKHMKKDNAHDLSPPMEIRKAPPVTEITSGAKLEAVASMRPLPMETETDGHELDVLFPTTNNIFASSAPNGNLLNSYPLVHMGDYTASLEEVARAIPPTPPTVKKQKASVQAAEAKSLGKCTPPNNNNNNNLGSAATTPFVSPYGEAKAAWDALSFLPNLGTSSSAGNIHNNSPHTMEKTSLLQRVHSLSFSDTDLRSVGSFDDPFADENSRGNNGNHNQERRQEQLEEGVGEARGGEGGPNQASNLLHGAPFPPPLSELPARNGVSFGTNRGGVSGGNSFVRSHSTRRNKSTSRRESSLSSKSLGSISNLNNYFKRKSIS